MIDFTKNEKKECRLVDDVGIYFTSEKFCDDIVLLMKEIEVVSSFDGERGFQPEQYCPDVALILADIDYTFIDTDICHRKGVVAIEKLLGKDFAQGIDDLFNLILVGHRKSSDENWSRRDEFNSIIEKTNELQKSLIYKKVWSRGVWIILIAEKLGISLEKKEVKKARDAYWEAFSKGSSLYPDVEVFIEGIKKDNLPLVLMTGSDSILKIQKDLSVDYDPGYSEERKKERLKMLPFKYEGLIIGDPVDKPDERFFNRVFEVIDGLGKYSKDRVLAIGDSKRNDLEVPQSMGCATLLIKRK